MRGVGGIIREANKSEALSHICRALFPLRSDGEGQVGGESAGDRLEHQALSSRDFLSSKESLVCCLFSFLFLCNRLKKIGGGTVSRQVFSV